MGFMNGIVFSFVCSVMLLALSFFVLLTNRKHDAQWIKTFGYVVAALLWVSAAIVFGGGFRERPCRAMNMDMKKMPPMMGEKMPCGDNPEAQEMRGGMDSKMEKMAPGRK